MTFHDKFTGRRHVNTALQSQTVFARWITDIEVDLVAPALSVLVLRICCRAGPCYLAMVTRLKKLSVMSITSDA